MTSIKKYVLEKKILIIWLWQQWKKLINFLISEWCKNNIIWVCKTTETKIYTENEYNITVITDYKKALKIYNKNISFIFIWVNPIKIQEEIYKYIY